MPAVVSGYERKKIPKCTATYISGFIGKKLLKHITCVACKNKILFREYNHDTDFIAARQYKNSKLITPGTFFNFLVSQTISRLFYLIPKFCHFKEISDILKNILENHLQFSLINCPLHTPSKQLIKMLIKYSIFFWCKKVNRILKGKDVKFIKFLKLKPNKGLIDPIKLSALKKYQNRCKTDKFKNKKMYEELL